MLPTLQPKTAPFWDVLMYKNVLEELTDFTLRKFLSSGKVFLWKSVCIYYNTGGHILEGSNFHIHRITYTNRSLCVSSHMRVPCLLPISDSCFTSRLHTALSLTTVLSSNAYQGFCFSCSSCFPSQVYSQCSFFTHIGTATNPKLCSSSWFFF
jgi:hypothetical protein